MTLMNDYSNDNAIKHLLSAFMLILQHKTENYKVTTSRNQQVVYNRIDFDAFMEQYSNSLRFERYIRMRRESFSWGLRFLPKS